MPMSEQDRENLLNEIDAMLSKPGGKQAVRYLLNAAGGIPIAGGFVAGAGSVWGEREQQAVNEQISDWLKLADENLNKLNSVMAAALSEPTETSMALLLGEVIGSDLADKLMSAEIGHVTVMLNSVTINELDPYVVCGLLTMTSTGSSTNMGARNSIGGHIEELKRPHGMGSGYTLQIAT